MYIFYLFEAVYISHDISLEKKGLECGRICWTGSNRHLKSEFPGIDNVFNFLFSPWASGGGGDVERGREG
jgi:hypothetical protein